MLEDGRCSKRGGRMITNIKVVFKDNRECLFSANTFEFEKDGFCNLYDNSNL